MRPLISRLGARAGVGLALAGWASCGLAACGSAPVPAASGAARSPRALTPASSAATRTPARGASQTAEQPLHGASSSRAAPVVPGSAVQEQLDEAGRAVLLLGRSAWSETRAKSAQALAALADLLEAAGEGRAARRQVAELRAQSDRLGGAGGASEFARVESIAVGLSSALTGLESLQLSEPSWLARWLDAARESIAGLKEGATTPALRAATVQDAFRATLDAFQAALQLAAREGGRAAARASPAGDCSTKGPPP